MLITLYCTGLNWSSWLWSVQTPIVIPLLLESLFLLGCADFYHSSQLLLLRLHNWSSKTGFRIWNVSSAPQGTRASKAAIMGCGPLREVLGCYQLNPLYCWGHHGDESHESDLFLGCLRRRIPPAVWSCLFTNDGAEKGGIAFINRHISNLLNVLHQTNPKTIRQLIFRC